MSKKRDDLIEILVEYFYNYKSYDLCEAMKSYGLIPDETLNPNNSKRIFAKAGIKKWRNGLKTNFLKFRL